MNRLTRAHMMAFATTLVLSSIPLDSAADDNAAAKAFDRQFVENIKAAKSHFMTALDCKNRDEQNGMRRSTLVLPGAIRSFIDDAEYTATYVFPKKTADQPDLHRFVRARAKANVPTGFEYWMSAKSSDAQIHHKATPDDFVTVSLTDAGPDLIVTFNPPTNGEIPFGNPCAKPPKPPSK